MRKLVHAVLTTTIMLAAVAAPAATLAQSRGGTLTANVLGGEPGTIDPDKASFAAETVVVRQVFEPLLTLDANLLPQPAAAESYDVSADGLTWTFHLRPDGAYSDGTPVTAADFVYSLKRLLAPETASPSASLFAGAIAGGKEYNAGLPGAADGVGLIAVDALTLQIQLTHPIGYLPSLVSLWSAVPLRQDVIAANPAGWANDPATYIGNGPFRLQEWSHQDHMTFVPNARYHGPGPQLGSMTFRMLGDNTADFAAYLNGEEDLVQVPPSDLDRVLSDPSLSGQAQRYTELTTSFLVLNNRQAPFNQPLVRQAISHGIDRAALVRDVEGGLGIPAFSLIPPGMAGYQPELATGQGFDVAQAQALLAQAGFTASTFPRVTFVYSARASNQTRAEFIQAQLKQNLGISIVLQPMESKAYLAAYRAGQFDLAYAGWGADYPDPQDFFNANFGCGSPSNHAGYCNPGFDALVAAGDAAADPAIRQQAYADAQNQLVQDAPVVFLDTPSHVALVNPALHGLVITPADDFPGSLHYAAAGF